MRMKTETRMQHLSDAEFSQLLDGAEPGASAEAHLGACAFCRGELAAVQTSLSSFRAVSTAWAEAEAPRRFPVPVRWLTGLRLQTSWGAGLAATAITGMLAFWLGVPAQTRWQAPVAHVAAAAPTNAELAEDNRLLLSIDEELSTPGQPEVSAEQMHVAPQRNAPRTAGLMTD